MIQKLTVFRDITGHMLLESDLQEQELWKQLVAGIRTAKASYTGVVKEMILGLRFTPAQVSAPVVEVYCIEVTYSDKSGLDKTVIAYSIDGRRYVYYQDVELAISPARILVSNA